MLTKKNLIELLEKKKSTLKEIKRERKKSEHRCHIDAFNSAVRSLPLKLNLVRDWAGEAEGKLNSPADWT